MVTNFDGLHNQFLQHLLFKTTHGELYYGGTHECMWEDLLVYINLLRAHQLMNDIYLSDSVKPNNLIPVFECLKTFTDEFAQQHIQSGTVLPTK